MLRYRIKCLEEDQKHTDKRFENFLAKREEVLSKSDEHADKLEAKIDQKFNTWAVILGIVIALAGLVGWKNLKDERHERRQQQKVANELLNEQKKVLEEGHKILEEQTQDRNRGKALLGEIATWQTSQNKDVVSEDPGKPQSAQYDENTINKAKETLDAEVKGEEASYKNILWSKAILAHDKNDWKKLFPYGRLSYRTNRIIPKRFSVQLWLYTLLWMKKLRILLKAQYSSTQL